MHRAFVSIAVLCTLVQGCDVDDFYGDSFEPVVDGDEVEIHDDLPAGYRRIGSVDGEEEDTIDGGSLLQRLLWCGGPERLTDRMQQTAADNGGEILYALECDHDEFPHLSWGQDEGERSWTCRNTCSADVGRRWDRDD